MNLQWNRPRPERTPHLPRKTWLFQQALLAALGKISAVPLPLPSHEHPALSQPWYDGLNALFLVLQELVIRCCCCRCCCCRCYCCCCCCCCCYCRWREWWSYSSCTFRRPLRQRKTQLVRGIACRPTLHHDLERMKFQNISIFRTLYWESGRDARF